MLSLRLYIYPPLVKPFPLAIVHICLSLSLWTCSWCYFKLDLSFIQAFQLWNVCIHLSAGGRRCRSLNLNKNPKYTGQNPNKSSLLNTFMGSSIHPVSVFPPHFPVYSGSGSWGAGVKSRSHWMRARDSPWTGHKLHTHTHTNCNSGALCQELCIFGTEIPVQPVFLPLTDGWIHCKDISI